MEGLLYHKLFSEWRNRIEPLSSAGVASHSAKEVGEMELIWKLSPFWTWSTVSPRKSTVQICFVPLSLSKQFQWNSLISVQKFPILTLKPTENRQTTKHFITPRNGQKCFLSSSAKTESVGRLVA